MADDLCATFDRLDRAVASKDQQAADAAKREIGAQWNAELAKAGPDAEKLISDPNLPISPHMAEGMLRTGSPVPVATWLGKNPTEAARIARLSPGQQIIEVARLSERVRSAPASRPAAPAAREESMESYLTRRNRENAEARHNAHKRI